MRNGGVAGQSVQDEDVCVVGVVMGKVLRPLMRA